MIDFLPIKSPITQYVIAIKSISPGEILLEEYLKPLGLSQNAMGRAIGVSPRANNEIVLGRRSITPEMSIRFGKYFGQSPQFWSGIQTNCDFRKLRKRERELTAKIEPLQRMAAT
jgi:addiction module HigA family antidote